MNYLERHKAEFSTLLDVNTPIIYIQDHDFVRVDEFICECTQGTEKKEWNPATGVTNYSTKEPFLSYDSLKDFLKSCLLDNKARNKYIILKNVHDCINDPEIKTYLHLIAQRRLYGEGYDTTIIIVSPKIVVPQELEKYVAYFEFDYPDDDALNEIIDVHIRVNAYDVNKFTLEDRKELLQSLKGMSRFDVDRVIDMAMSKDGSLSANDKEMILKQKKKMVKNSGLLELIDTSEDMNSIGGLSALKTYLQSKAKVIDNLVKAQTENVAIPKGVFIVGMPGCGKSLCAKVASSMFKVPLLRLDMGSMLGKYVGDSESNLRRAIKIAEAAAPCILWIDEIEKGFSGVGGNNDVMTRMFGYFLSWLQDKKSAVYVIATANNADSLPPELKRKGRFDEIFCVKLPDKEERKDIFKVHLNKRNANVKEPDDELLNITDGFNGADIEAVVCEAKEKAFLLSLNKESYDFMKILKEIAKETISISKSCKKQIDDMDKIFKENCFKNASKK